MDGEGEKNQQEGLDIITPTRRESLDSIGSHATLGFYVSGRGPLFR